MFECILFDAFQLLFISLCQQYYHLFLYPKASYHLWFYKLCFNTFINIRVGSWIAWYMTCQYHGRISYYPLNNSMKTLWILNFNDY